MRFARILPCFIRSSSLQRIWASTPRPSATFDSSLNLSSSWSLFRFLSWTLSWSLSWILVTSFNRILAATLPERGSLQSVCHSHSSLSVLDCSWLMLFRFLFHVLLLAVGYALFTSCRSASFPPVVGPLFWSSVALFWSLGFFAPWDHPSRSCTPCLLTLSRYSLLASVRHGLRDLLIELFQLPGVAACECVSLSSASAALTPPVQREVSVSPMSWLYLHVLTHVFFSARSLTCCSSTRSLTCCAWSGGHPAPPSASSARCAWMRSWFAFVRLPSHDPADDADMLALIDRSACLVEPAVVELLYSYPVLLPPSALSTSSAASGRCSRISPSRFLVEGLVLLRAAHPELLLSPHCD